MLRFKYVLPPAGLVLVILAAYYDLTPLAFMALAVTTLGFVIILVAASRGRRAPAGDRTPDSHGDEGRDEAPGTGVLARLRPSSAELVSIRVDDLNEVRRLADLLAEAGVHAHVRVHSEPLDASIWRPRAGRPARGMHYELLVREDDAYVARLLDHALRRMREKVAGSPVRDEGTCPTCGAVVRGGTVACPSCGLMVARHDA